MAIHFRFMAAAEMCNRRQGKRPLSASPYKFCPMLWMSPSLEGSPNLFSCNHLHIIFCPFPIKPPSLSSLLCHTRRWWTHVLSVICLCRFFTRDVKAWQYFFLHELWAYFEEIKWSWYIHVYFSLPYTNQEIEKVDSRKWREGKDGEKIIKQSMPEFKFEKYRHYQNLKEDKVF